MYSSRPDASRRRALWWAIIRHDAPQILNTALFVVLMVGVAAAAYWFHNRARRDWREAVPQQAEGLVTLVAYHPVDESNHDRYRLAYLSVDDKVLVPSPAFSPGRLGRGVPLHIGQPVRFTYRVGKSGTWHLDRVEPLKREP